MGADKLEENLTFLEHDIRRQTGASDFHWFGRAGTALYVAFKSVIEKNNRVEAPEIILPSLSCATPSNTALMAGFKVRYSDVDLKDGLVTLENIKQRVTKNTIAVLLIHLYGNTGNAKEISEWCAANNIVLIEDIAQATGALLPDHKSVGSYGDFSVFSFNKTKIIEDGGGLLILKNQSFKNTVENKIEELEYSGIGSTDRKSLALSYRNLHHSLVALLRMADHETEKRISDSFMNIRNMYAPLYLEKFKYNPDLLKSWELLDQNIANRNAKAQLYREKLAANDKVRIISNAASNVCWRFSLVLDNTLDLHEISEQVRKDGFHVSNLYWPVNEFFYPSDTCPNTKFISRNIINLWVDASVNEEYVIRCAESLTKHINHLR